MEYQFIPLKALDAINAKKWIIVLTAVVSFIVGMLLGNPKAPDKYTATVTIYGASYLSYKESKEGIDAMVTYMDIVKSRKVAQRASNLMTQTIAAEQIMAMVDTSYTSDSAVLTLYVTYTNPTLAVQIANIVAKAFVHEIGNITAVEGVQILDSAQEAYKSSSGLYAALKFCMVFTFACVFIVVSLIAVRALLDKRVAFPREVTLEGELELLGVIPYK